MSSVLKENWIFNSLFTQLATGEQRSTTYNHAQLLVVLYEKPYKDIEVILSDKHNTVIAVLTQNAVDAYHQSFDHAFADIKGCFVQIKRYAFLFCTSRKKFIMRVDLFEYEGNESEVVGNPSDVNMMSSIKEYTFMRVFDRMRYGDVVCTRWCAELDGLNDGQREYVEQLMRSNELFVMGKDEDAKKLVSERRDVPALGTGTDGHGAHDLIGTMHVTSSVTNDDIRAADLINEALGGNAIKNSGVEGTGTMANCSELNVAKEEGNAGQNIRSYNRIKDSFHGSKVKMGLLEEVVLPGGRDAEEIEKGTNEKIIDSSVPATIPNMANKENVPGITAEDNEKNTLIDQSYNLTIALAEGVNTERPERVDFSYHGNATDKTNFNGSFGRIDANNAACPDGFTDRADFIDLASFTDPTIFTAVTNPADQSGENASTARNEENTAVEESKCANVLERFDYLRLGIIHSPNFTDNSFTFVDEEPCAGIKRFMADVAVRKGEDGTSAKYENIMSEQRGPHVNKGGLDVPVQGAVHSRNTLAVGNNGNGSSLKSSGHILSQLDLNLSMNTKNVFTFESDADEQWKEVEDVKDVNWQKNDEKMCEQMHYIKESMQGAADSVPCKQINGVDGMNKEVMGGECAVYNVRNALLLQKCGAPVNEHAQVEVPLNITKHPRNSSVNASNIIKTDELIETNYSDLNKVNDCALMVNKGRNGMKGGDQTKRMGDEVGGSMRDGCKERVHVNMCENKVARRDSDGRVEADCGDKVNGKDCKWRMVKDYCEEELKDEEEAYKIREYEMEWRTDEMLSNYYNEDERRKVEEKSVRQEERKHKILIGDNLFYLVDTLPEKMCEKRAEVGRNCINTGNGEENMERCDKDKTMMEGVGNELEKEVMGKTGGSFCDAGKVGASSAGTDGVGSKLGGVCQAVRKVTEALNTAEKKCEFKPTKDTVCGNLREEIEETAQEEQTSRNMGKCERETQLCKESDELIKNDQVGKNQVKSQIEVAKCAQADSLLMHKTASKPLTNQKAGKYAPKRKNMKCIRLVKRHRSALSTSYTLFTTENTENGEEETVRVDFINTILKNEIGQRGKKMLYKQIRIGENDMRVDEQPYSIVRIDSLVKTEDGREDQVIFTIKDYKLDEW